MTIALLAGANGHVAAQGTKDGVTSAARDTSGASGIFLGTNYIFGTPPVISDSNSNTWSLLGTQHASDSICSSRLYYCANPTVGAGHTFSALNTDCYASLAAIIVSGMMTSSPLDGSAVGTASAVGVVSLQVPSITPSVAGNIEVTLLSAYTSTADWGIDDSFLTTDILPIVGGTSFDIAMAYKILTTTGAESPVWAWTTLSPAMVQGAQFKAAVAGASHIKSATDVALANLKSAKDILKANLKSVKDIPNS